MGLYLTDDEMIKVITETVKTTLSELHGEFSLNNQIMHLKNRNNQLERNNESLKKKIEELKKANKTKRVPITSDKRHKIFQKYDHRCCECGATNKQTRLTIDHILPVALGGTNSIDNLQVLCEECNQSKGTATWRGGSKGLLPVKVRLSELGVQEDVK